MYSFRTAYHFLETKAGKVLTGKVLTAHNTPENEISSGQLIAKEVTQSIGVAKTLANIQYGELCNNS